MPTDPITGAWMPGISPKQQEFRQRIHPQNPEKKKFFCLSGPRRSSKTIAALHAIAEHCWEVDNANVVMVAPTMSTATDGGPWEILTTWILQEWIDAGFGMEWVREPYTEGISKRQKCKVRNKHGGTSTIMLESLREGEKEISKRFKSRVFSFIYWSEAGSWVQQRSSFDFIIECLRVPGLPARQHTLLVDTNPADSGTLHWIYQLFYEFRVSDDVPEDLTALQENLDLMEFFVSDNPYLSVDDVRLLKAQYAHDPDLQARYLDGRWVAASGNALFAKQFRPIIHVIPAPGSEERDPEILVPELSCGELHVGWDPGTTNHALVFFERVYRTNAQGREESVFKAFDEIVELKTDLLLRDLVEMCSEKMDYWENLLGRKVLWSHWSDRSAFDYREAISGVFPHQEIFLASRGRITLHAVEKGDGTVKQRIDLTRLLLFQDRLFVSRDNCPELVRSLQALEKGRNTQPVNRSSRYKHAWDALTYGVSSLCYDEMAADVRKEVRSAGGGGSGFIQIPL
jgi:hypothetical protein